MRNTIGGVLLIILLGGLAIPCAAGPVENVWASTAVDFHSVTASFQAETQILGAWVPLYSTNDTVGPYCIAKAAGSFNLDISALLEQFPGLPAVNVTGSSASGNRIIWTVNQNFNQLVTVDTGSSTMTIYLRNITGKITAIASAMALTYNNVCGRYFDVRLDCDKGADKNYFTLTGNLDSQDGIPLRVNVSAIDFLGYSGLGAIESLMAEWVNYPATVVRGASTDLQFRVKGGFNGALTGWALREADGAAYTTVRAVYPSPETALTANNWLTVAVTNVVPSDWDDEGNGPEFYVWVQTRTEHGEANLCRSTAVARITITEPPPVLVSITVAGPTSLYKNSGASYTCTANYDRGPSQNVTGAAAWSENSEYAVIDMSGRLTTLDVPSAQPCRVQAVYGGFTNGLDVTIRNEAPSLVSIGVYGPDAVFENQSADFSCSGLYNDGSQRDLTAQAAWSENSAYASISTGRLTATAVSADQSCTVTAICGGFTNNKAITIRNLVLQRLLITGPAQVPENSQTNYACLAVYNNGATNTVTAETVWDENSPYATMSAGGVLTAAGVTAAANVRITATYGGSTTNKDVVILNSVAELAGLTITGPTTVVENAFADFVCVATYNNASSSNVTWLAAWSADSANASVSAAGRLMVSNLTASEICRLTAAFGGLQAVKDVQLVNVPPSLTGLLITGPAAVNENTQAVYHCTAQYGDGSSLDVTAQAVWGENAAAATITNGVLTVGELTSNVACRITAAYQGRNAQYDINLLNTTEVFVASASVIYPVAYTDRTVCVYVWDNTAQAWIQGADVVRPAQITVANIQANQYYWIGVWDYIAGAFTLAEWFGRFNTPEHGRFVGHVYSSPPAAAIGLPDDVLDISASAGHLLKPFVVNMTTQVWSDGAPFTSTGFCTFEPDAWHTWYWLVFFDYTTGRFY